MMNREEKKLEEEKTSKTDSEKKAFSQDKK